MWQQIRQVMEEQRRGCLLTIIGGDGIAKELMGKKLFHDYQTGLNSGSLPKDLNPMIEEVVDKRVKRTEVLELGAKTKNSNFSRIEIFVQPLIPPANLLILGGGHIAFSLVELGKMMGFRVIIVDDRPEFANPVRLPQADQVICNGFAQALDEFPITEETYIVIATRGHRYDQICLGKVIGSKAAYIGMVGSTRRIVAMKEYLQDQGLTAELLGKLHSPIGLAIGAETPAEIALSIISEVVKTRRLEQVIVDRKKGEHEIEASVIEKMVSIEVSHSDQPVVLATIIEVRGSAPRKPGAQMLIFRDGQTVGTIGGGCAEAEVKRTARAVFSKGLPVTYTVDLTNAIAADEGMVCGGIMKVFLARVN